MVGVIESITVGRHRLPLDPPFPAAWDPVPRAAFPVDVIRVRDTSGAEGIGAGHGLSDPTEYESLFIGADVQDLDRHQAVIDDITFHGARAWPLEVALWDLAGKLSGEPVWRMVGGGSNRVALYASLGTHRHPEETARSVRAAVARGFRAIKLRFGRGSVGDDLTVLDAVRDAVGRSVALMVDCNQGWRIPGDTRPPWSWDEARRVARALSERDVWWMEEPLHRGDHSGMARLRAEGLVRIAGGEMARELHELRLMLAAGSLDVYQPDAVLTGGIGGLRRLAVDVVEAGHMFSPHTWGSGVALVANAHLTAGTVGTDFLEYPYDPPEWTEARRDFLLTRPIVADGDLTLDETPGLGVTLDEERLATTAIPTAWSR